MANLTLLTGIRQGETLPLRKHKSVLGRSIGCDIVINEAMVDQPTADRPDIVSRTHAVVSCVGGTFYIEDGDGQGHPSHNGTYVNDKKLTGRLPLRNNDRIRICNFGCTFHEDAEVDFAVEAAIDHDSSVQSLYVQPAEKLRVLLEISNSLSNTLDPDVLLPRIVEQLFQLFRQADRGFIILGTEASGPLIVRAFKSRRPGDEADARFSASIVRRCLGNREGILGNDLARQFPDSESICELPVRSLMCAPLWTQDGQPLGAIQLDARGQKTRFTEDDLKLLLGVASQASITLSNARLHRDALALQRREAELEVANQVQRALLPQCLPDLPGYQFFAHYQSAQQIGGDYYDFIPLPRQRLAVLLGDVAGKGIPAALVMAKFSVEARVCLETEADLAVAVSRLNALMARVAVADRFVTLVAVVLDPATHTATLVNAGHPSPLLCRHDGKVEQATPVEGTGPPVGVTDGYVYTGSAIRLLPGDNLLLFSDGVTDALGAQDQLFGKPGVYAVLEGARVSPRETGERLIRAVSRHASGCSQYDDITVVCFGRVGVDVTLDL